jgi:hypothetical protein
VRATKDTPPRWYYRVPEEVWIAMGLGVPALAWLLFAALMTNLPLWGAGLLALTVALGFWLALLLLIYAVAGAATLVRRIRRAHLIRSRVPLA